MHQNGNGNAPLVSEQVELPPDTDSQPWLRVLETQMATAQVAARLNALAIKIETLQREYAEVNETLCRLDVEAKRASEGLRDALIQHYARRTSWQQ